MTSKLLTEHHLEFPKLKRRLHRLLWVYTCQNATLLEITCHGSNNIGRLRALQLSSNQRYIVRTGAFYFAFWLWNASPIKHQRLVIVYAVISHIALNAYLTTSLLLFRANFRRYISKRFCSRSKRMTIQSKSQNIHLYYEHFACFDESFLNELFTHF